MNLRVVGFLCAPLEDAVVVVVDEVEAGPGRLAAARQGDLPPVEGVEPLVVRGRVRHARGDHDAVAVVERDEAAVEGSVVQRVEQEPELSTGICWRYCEEYHQERGAPSTSNSGASAT